MASNYGVRDVGEVFFFDKKTGEKILIGETVGASVDVDITERSTNYTFNMGHIRSATITVKNFDISNGLIELFVHDKEVRKEVARLGKIQKRTKNKRIKKKLNNRIVAIAKKELGW